ncbi:MAG TPA: hypothetical protein VGJ05_11645 [Fimbriiglobus sp.]
MVFVFRSPATGKYYNLSYLAPSGCRSYTGGAAGRCGRHAR